jgi:hypothetical protein
MKTQIETLNEMLRAIGFRSAIWQDRRIYINKDKTAKCYFEFDDPQNTDFKNPLKGAALKVYSNCESQSQKWNVNRAAELKALIIETIREDEDMEALISEIEKEG